MSKRTTAEYLEVKCIEIEQTIADKKRGSICLTIIKNRLGANILQAKRFYNGLYR